MENVDKSKKNFSFIAISIVVGFMVAIQFQTVKQPIKRDTRDIWELREALLAEKELQSDIISEMRSIEETLAAYESKRKQSKGQALTDTLEELKLEAGLTEIKAPGITLTIEPAFDNIQLGDDAAAEVSPELLKRLLNELNQYEAKYVAIDGWRIINTTVIRDINNETKIDGHSLTDLPIKVVVGVDQYTTAEKLYNRMKVSKAIEEFFIDNLKLTVSEPSGQLTIPAYDNPIRVRYLESMKADEGGGS